MFRLELRRSSREIDESKSDVINTVGVPQIQYIDRTVDIRVPVMRGRWCFLFSQEACVCVLEACDVKIELGPWMDRDNCLMKRMPEERGETTTARDRDPRTREEPARDRDPRTSER